MGEITQIYSAEPVFTRALLGNEPFARAWLGEVVQVNGVDVDFLDLAIDPKRFTRHPSVRALLQDGDLGKVRSSDEHANIECYLSGIVFALNFDLPDEALAWSALEGRASEEFPVRSIGNICSVFEPWVVRRLAGLLDCTMPLSRNVKELYAALEANQVYPGSWNDVSVPKAFDRAYNLLVSTFRESAKRGDAILMRRG